MQALSTEKKNYADKMMFLTYALIGGLLITFSSFVKIPFFPVPFTLQTLAVLFLALVQSPKLAVASTITYLVLGTLGLPVFGGNSDVLWITDKCGGYLVGFPIAAYVLSKMVVKRSVWLGILFSHLMIYLFGFLWLAFFFDATIAFHEGVLFFLPSALVKSIGAVFLAYLWKKWRYEKGVKPFSPLGK